MLLCLEMLVLSFNLAKHKANWLLHYFFIVSFFLWKKECMKLPTVQNFRLCVSYNVYSIYLNVVIRFVCLAL